MGQPQKISQSEVNGARDSPWLTSGRQSVHKEKSNHLIYK